LAEAIQLCAPARGGRSGGRRRALQLARQLRPFDLDVVLLDAGLSGADGSATATRLLDADAEFSMVFLAQSLADRDVFDALQAGAVGYLSKHMPPDVLVRALQAFARGENLPIPRAIGEKILATLRERRATPPPSSPKREPEPRLSAPLTKREQEVFDLIARGARDREIADTLVVSQSTVKKHVQNMLRKLQGAQSSPGHRVAARPRLSRFAPARPHALRRTRHAQAPISARTARWPQPKHLSASTRQPVS
jgi:NarL family two-component system response regulator LiaR